MKGINKLFRPAQFRWWILGFILVLLCLPGSALPGNSFLDRIHFDKWVHVFLFGGLSLSWGSWVYESMESSRWSLGLRMVRLGGVLLGVALEWVQKTWVPLRSWDDLDILADLIGVLLGSWLSGQMRKGKEKRG